MSGIGALQHLGSFGQTEAPAISGASTVRDDRIFADLLRTAAGGKETTSFPGNSNNATGQFNPSRMPARDDQLRQSAKQLVGSALLIPVLEEMDVSPLRPTTGPFAQNVVEKRFGPIAHQYTADRIMQSRSFGLVDAVVRSLGGSVVDGMEVRA